MNITTKLVIKNSLDILQIITSYIDKIKITKSYFKRAELQEIEIIFAQCQPGMTNIPV